MTDRAFVLSRSTSIMFGHTTSCIIGQKMAGPTERSTSSTSSAECLVIKVKKAQLNRRDRCTDRLFIVRGVPTYIRSDNGPEFIAEAVRLWIKAVGAKTAYRAWITLGERLHAAASTPVSRNELLNGKIFYSLREAQIVIKQWRRHYNTKRPHSAIGYRPPAPESVIHMEERPCPISTTLAPTLVVWR